MRTRVIVYNEQGSSVYCRDFSGVVRYTGNDIWEAQVGDRTVLIRLGSHQLLVIEEIK